MITRAQYMADSSLHHAYYLEIAQEAHVRIRKETLALAQKSTDKHLNDIPLPEWDVQASIHSRSIDAAMRKRGDFWSMAGGVCTVKALAKHLAVQA